MDKYFYNIDCFRFIFSLIIVYFHILHANIMKFVENTPSMQNYEYLAKISSNSYLIVECFFIIAGFFLFLNFKILLILFILTFVIKHL